MAAQVADWSEVKATAIGTGSLKEAAEHHGISHDSVKQRAKREAWPVGRRVHRQVAEAKLAAATQIVQSSQGRVTRVTSAADALANTLLERKEQTRLHLSRYTVKASAEASKLEGEELLAAAPSVKAVADVAGKVWPEQQQANDGAVVVNIALISQLNPG